MPWVKTRRCIFNTAARQHGPDTAVEDAAFIPKESEMRDAMVGVELRHGEKILFRGGVLDYGNYAQFYNEEGEIVSFRQTVVEVNAGTTTVLDEHGNVVDPMEPSVSTLLDLMDGPRLYTEGRLGHVVLWRARSASSQPFRFFSQMNSSVGVYPSKFVMQTGQNHLDWEIATRYIAWTVLPILAMGIFVVGLQ